MNILNILKRKKKESLLWQSSYLNTTVQVWEKNERRELRFGNKIIQSAFHKRQPQYLVLPYTRFMLMCLIFCPKPQSILHIGLGGGSIVRWLYQEFPNTNQTIIEINSDVIEVAYRFFELPEDKRLQVINADASQFITKISEKFDLIFLDAFNDFGASEEIKGVGFLRSLSSCLSNSGWIVGNFWTLTGDFKNQCDIWKSKFTNVFKARANEKGNEILFGSQNREIKDLNDFDQMAKTLEFHHLIEFKKMKSELIIL